VVLATSLGVLFVAGEVAGQREVRLGAAEARHEAGFGLMRSVVELTSGSVVLADPLGTVLVRLDRSLTREDTLGRLGAGPEEYRQPDIVHALPGDSVLMVDLGNTRLTVIGPDGRFVSTSSLLRSAGESAGPAGVLMMIAGGTDDRGGVYFQGSAMGPAGVRDSIELFRYDRGTQQIQTVAKLKAVSTERRESGSTNNRNVRVMPVPLSPSDGWAVSRSGTVYIARSGDYHIEVIAAGGGRRSGDAVSYRPVSIGSAEREEYAEEQARNGAVAMSVQVVNGERSVSLSRNRPQGAPPADLAWPRQKPPFEANSLRVDRTGRVWVRRSQSAGTPALYDVFDAQGAHVGSVRFPADRVLVGFGANALYAAHADDVDLHHLERYALPL
jgi:hypothetical protein